MSDLIARAHRRSVEAPGRTGRPRHAKKHTAARRRQES
jgi:hypothetical protein